MSGKIAENSFSSPSHQPGLRFAALFILAALLLTGLLPSLFDPAAQFTIVTTKTVGSLLGLTMTSSGDILTVNGFAMRIIGQCTALNYFFILAVAMLLYTRHPLAYRLKGVVAAALIISAVNAVRLIITGLAGTVSYRLFEIVHEYLWVALFALLVFAVWKVWADRRLILTAGSLKKIVAIIVACAGVFLILVRFKEAHAALLALLATPVFKLVIADRHAGIVADGVEMIFRSGGDQIRTGLFFETANLAVYAGLTAPLLLRSRSVLKLILAGMAVLTAIYAEFLAFVGWQGILYGQEQAQSFMYVGSSILLALPMAMYWITIALSNRE